MAKRYGERWEVRDSLRPGGQADTFIVADLQNPEGPELVLKRLRNPMRHGRFEREVGVLQRLRHPNIVQIVDASIGETSYLVMEYCRGGSLEDQKGRWASRPEAALSLFAEICDGVAAAHVEGVTHRDIKPSNVLLSSSDGGPKVADFGLAFVLDETRETSTDEAVGARLFIAPELADGRSDDVTPRSDVYSLGKLLYWLLSGGRIFDRERHRHSRYDLARSAGGRPILEHVNRMLDRMITLEPEDRLASATEVAAEARKVGALLSSGARVLTRDIPEQCAFCRQGFYTPLRMNGSTDVQNFGLRSVGDAEWRVLVCDHCGNIQLFRPKYTGREWWGSESDLPPGR